MSVPAGKTTLLLALAVSLIVGTSSAQAANIAPNPGFEANCSGVPCNWTGGSSSSIARDTVNPHSGLGSIAVTADGTDGAGALSDCFVVSAYSPYNLDVWYRTSSVDVYAISLAVQGFASSDCTTFFDFATLTDFLPVTTGDWTQELIGPMTIVPPVQSARIALSFRCSRGAAPPCPANTTVNFDDVAVQSEPLAVTVASFAAQPVSKGVLLRWQTASEVDLLGFVAYRSRAHGWQRLTRSLITHKGSVSGASYRFLDRTTRRGVSYRYRMKAVNRDGTAAWFGPVRVA